jgi:hypothetical protein
MEFKAKINLEKEWNVVDEFQVLGIVSGVTVQNNDNPVSAPRFEP